MKGKRMFVKEQRGKPPRKGNEVEKCLLNQKSMETYSEIKYSLNLNILTGEIVNPLFLELLRNVAWQSTGKASGATMNW